MIITEQKDIDKIYESIKPYNKILIAGCDGCCQPPRSINEAKTLGQLLQLKAKTEGKDLKWKAITILRQCDDRIAATTVRPHLEGFDAIVSLACGLGVVMMNKVLPEILTFPAQDSQFGGVQNNGENYYVQYCETCGNCLLGVTGGVCPIAGCAKHLNNGPCGGTVDGKCEVGGYTRPCAWIEIYKRLKKFNRLDLFKAYRPARDYRSATSPAYITIYKDYTNIKEEKEEKT
ncbi:MAG: methylenetetrahydrofolate reductase C-terminal domain-containing protein [Candidatus Hermodarchaeota archaeon]